MNGSEVEKLQIKSEVAIIMKEKQKSLIERIKLDSATFHGEVVEPTFVNFFFGKNGAGKSTIAKVIKDGSEVA